MSKVTYIDMPWTEFAGFEDHPHQRDTERHAEFAKKKHLATAHEVHNLVHAAEWGGKRYKVDGHTRSFLWASGELVPTRNEVHVEMFYPETQEEFHELYMSFDSKTSVQTAADTAQGSLRQAGIKLDTPMFAKGSGLVAPLVQAGAWLRGIELFSIPGITGVKIADMATTLDEFRTELTILDGLGLTPKKFPLLYLAGAVVVLRSQPILGAEFISAIAAEKGRKAGEDTDVIYMLEQWPRKVELKLKGMIEYGAIPEGKTKRPHSISPVKLQFIPANIRSYIAARMFIAGFNAWLRNPTEMKKGWDLKGNEPWVKGVVFVNDKQVA
jgi:hypothetical protein